MRKFTEEFEINNQKKLLISLNDLDECEKKVELINDKPLVINSYLFLSILICPLIYGVIIKLVLDLLNQEQLGFNIFFSFLFIHMTIIGWIYINNLINTKNIDYLPIVSTKNELDNIIKEFSDINKKFEILLEEKLDQIIIRYTSKSSNQSKIIKFLISDGVDIIYYQEDNKLNEYLLNGKIVNKNNEEYYLLTFFIPKKN